MDEVTRALDVDMRHDSHIGAPVPLVWRALLELDLRDSPLVRLLLTLRGLRRRGPLTLETLAAAGFRTVRREAPTDLRSGGELAMGLIAQPWRLRGGVHRGDADDLDSFDDPGHAVITWTYRLEPAGSGTDVTTRTTVRCTDDVSRRRFRRYWRLVGPFSALIRRESLRLLRRRVEHLQQAG